jgi:sulfur-oxidizing protein SoxY
MRTTDPMMRDQQSTVLPIDRQRRTLLLGASAAAAMTQFVAALTARQAAAQTASKALPPPPPSWEEAYRKIIGNAKPIEGQIKVELPEVAENGNTVPLAIQVESPMSQLDHVKSIYLFATANPVPTIATFHFTPQAGAANVASRIRLAKSQEIVVLAESSAGRFMMQKRFVKVTIGGCGG